MEKALRGTHTQGRVRRVGVKFTAHYLREQNTRINCSDFCYLAVRTQKTTMDNTNPVEDPTEDVAVGNETSEEALITMNNGNPVADPAEDVAMDNETSEEDLITMNNDNPVADPAEDVDVGNETSEEAQITNSILWLNAIEEGRRTHDNLWSQVSTYNNPSPQQNDPNMPNVLEKNFILAVAVIWTEDIPGIVDGEGQPGEFYVNVMAAIIHYYDRKGWDGLDQDFLFRVYEDMQSGTGETGGGRAMS